MQSSIFNLRFFTCTFAVFLFIAHCPLSIVHCATVSGTVSDAVSGAIIPGVNVLVEGLNRGAVSNAAGQFEIADILDGQYTISASHLGYGVGKQRVSVSQSAVLTLQLTPTILPGQEVIITGTRADGRTPMAFANLHHERIAAANQGQDIPMLLQETPNLLSYSESGNGIGYSYLKIRGFGQQRVNVMINNVPLNDPEDHQVYWVDLPDVAESVQDIQVQRGVGGMVGLSGFGGSVNVVTDNLTGAQGVSLTTGFGSYGTRKYTAQFRSGLINNTYAVYGRYSKVLTDGYRERSGLDAWAYFIGAARFDANMTTRVNIFSGPFHLDAAWDAVAEADLKLNHRANPTHYHANVPTTDNFNQPQYQLQHEWRLRDGLTLSNTLFYVHGEGYYETFKTGADLVAHGYDYYPGGTGQTISEFDIVRQKWVDKDQIGWLPRLDVRHSAGRGQLAIGGELSDFWSSHWGEVKWASNLPPDAQPNLRYYDYDGKKWWATVYAHENYALTPSVRLMAELQLQYKKRTMEQKSAGNFSGAELNYYVVDYTFFNPKLGVNYEISSGLSAFGNFSVGQREPTDADMFDQWQGADDFGVDPLFAKSKNVYKADGSIRYVEWSDPLTQHETVYDYELGLSVAQISNLWSWNAKLNLYRMDFRNELVPYGQVVEEGRAVRGNADKTLHQGLELSTAIKINPKGFVSQPLGFDDDQRKNPKGQKARPLGLELSGNIAFSQNEFVDFTAYSWDGQPQRLDGQTIALFPSALANLRATANWTLAAVGNVSLSAQYQYAGQQYLDNTEDETRTVDPYGVLNLNASLKVNRLRDLTFRVWLNNALDKEYETSGYYDDWAGSNYYYPAAGRNGYGSVTVGF